MYRTSLLFRVKDQLNLDNNRIPELFFKAWIDEVCNNEVQYKVEHNLDCDQEILRIDFEKLEDAVAVKLKGVPLEFQKYLEIINLG